MRRMYMLMYIKGILGVDFTGLGCHSLWLNIWQNISWFYRIRVAAAAAASFVARAPSSRRLTSQKPGVSEHQILNFHMHVSLLFPWKSKTWMLPTFSPTVCHYKCIPKRPPNPFIQFSYLKLWWKCSIMQILLLGNIGRGFIHSGGGWQSIYSQTLLSAYLSAFAVYILLRRRAKI